mmetsp:Transcript_15704/g.28280  ORF Transcript_15704/g.28280 Transcript_15704/m.28280 type:complete len:348 (+) Transcript_15704:32-1075(+)
MSWLHTSLNMHRSAFALVCLVCAVHQDRLQALRGSLQHGDVVEVDAADAALSLKPLAALFLSLNPATAFADSAHSPHLSALSPSFHAHRRHQQVILADSNKELANSAESDSASPLRPKTRGSSRRAILGAFAAMTAMPFKAWSSSYSDLDPATEKNQKKDGCRAGYGKDCDKIANNNPYIIELQKKSRETKDQTLADRYDILQMQMYDDAYFDTTDVALVKLPNGSFGTFTKQKLAELKKAGRIYSNGLDYLDDPTAFYGKPPVEQAPRVLQDGDSIEYDELKERLRAQQVKKVVFQAPDGMKADVFINDKKVTLVLDKKFKRQEIGGACTVQKVPNNLKEILAGRT